MSQQTATNVATSENLPAPEGPPPALPPRARPSTYLTLVVYLLVGLLVGVKWMQIIPDMAGVVVHPAYIYVYAILDLVAVGLILSAYQLFGRMRTFGLVIWFAVLHVPLWLSPTPGLLPNLFRTVVLVLGMLVGLWMGGRRIERELRLGALALQDPLTGLSNSRQFYTDVERLLAESVRYGTRGAVLFIDLDEFKAINDVYGHRAGDEYLRALADWLRGCVRRADSVGRIGGDEFAVLLSHVDARQAAIVAERIRSAIHLREARYKGNRLHSTASVGVARVPFDGTTLDEILGGADAAMYRAKARGGNRVEFCSE
jgi:diguanylate cyclase (GGDEF)-like protein